MSKYGVFSGPYFRVLNTGKYGPESTPYLDTFHAVLSMEGDQMHTIHFPEVKFCGTFFLIKIREHNFIIINRI